MPVEDAVEIVSLGEGRTTVPIEKIVGIIGLVAPSVAIGPEIGLIVPNEVEANANDPISAVEVTSTPSMGEKMADLVSNIVGELASYWTNWVRLDVQMWPSIQVCVVS